MLHAISTRAIGLAGVGLFVRRTRPALHWKFMVSAFVIDIALVLYIELTRKAVEGLPKAGPLLHGRGDIRAEHRKVGIAFNTRRNLNYVTSFSG